MGFPPADAMKFAGAWLRFRREPRVSTVAENVTNDSTIDGLNPGGSLTNVARTKSADSRSSASAERPPSRASGSSHALARPDGKRLPVSDVITAPGGSLRVTYSRWNEPVRVHVPLDFIDSDTGKASGTVA